MPEMAALAYETAAYRGVVLDGGTAAYDEVVCNDSVTDAHRSRSVAHDRPVPQPAGAADYSMVSDPDSVDVAGVTYGDMTSDDTS